MADAPNTPENEAVVNHSASQMSYDNRLGNFGAYIAILQNVPEYNPNEADLKLVDLNATLADLQAKNDAGQRGVCASESSARGPRQSFVHGRWLDSEHRLAG